MKARYLATAVNGAVVLYWRKCSANDPSPWNHMPWTPDRNRATRFARKDQAAKHGTPVRVSE